ncbi:NUDIX hydrolase [Macrococcus equipercicus]|nr:NUDIX hydrolase [Macrococcus equipercicus]KAA1040156.1 NUDIX hydrolase [Macrococcus equipercicus]
MTFEERTLQKEEIYSGRIITVEKHDVELPNGHRTTREIVKHPGAVAVLAVHEGKVLLIKQFRQAMEEVLIEVPAGKVEQGETRDYTALRELEEETGYTTDDITHLYDFYVSPGFCDELISLYYTDQLIPSDELTADDDEFVEKMWVPVDKVKQLLQSNQVRDAKTMLALQYLLLNCNHSN